MLKDQLFFSVTCRSPGSFVLSGWWKAVHREVWQGFHSAPFLGMSTFLGSAITQPDTLTVALQLFFQEYLIFLFTIYFSSFNKMLEGKQTIQTNLHFSLPKLIRNLNPCLFFLNSTLVKKGDKKRQMQKNMGNLLKMCSFLIP